MGGGNPPMRRRSDAMQTQKFARHRSLVAIKILMLPKNKITSAYILYPLVALVLVAIVMISVAPGVVHAVGPTATPAPPATPSSGGTAANTARSLSGNSLSRIGNIAGNALLVYAVVYYAQEVASGIMIFSGMVLDLLFGANTSLAPANISVVLTGWGIMRDIANSLFILIVLWIALTIIFNIENLGGKKLLIRVVIIALFINFSLALVSAVFGFANLLAQPFQEAINGKNGKTSLSAIIVGRTKIYNAVKTIGAGEVKELKDRAAAAESAGTTASEAPPGFTYSAPINSARAELGFGGQGIACGLASLLTVFTGPGALGAGGVFATCLSVAPLISTWAESFFSSSGDLTANPIKQAMNMTIGTIFLLLTAFAFLAAALVLLWRFIAMVFLSVLAPAAFLLYAMPGKFGSKYWEMWLESLLKWAFFAPAFYFLMYISLLILTKMSEGQDKITTFTGNLDRIFTLIVFLGFLFATIGVARKMGITVADSFIKWGQKMGWAGLGFAGGVVTRTALPLLGRGAAAVEKRLGRVENPFLRRAAGIPAGGLRQIASAGRKSVLSAQKGFEGMTDEEIQRALGQRAYLTSADRTGMILELAKRKALASKEGIEGYGPEQMRAAVDQLKSVNADFMPILKANPSIAQASDFKSINDKDIQEAIKEAMIKGYRFESATKEGRRNEAAQWLTWKKVDPNDIPKLETKVLDNKKAMEMFVLSASGGSFGQLAREKPAAAKKVNEYLNAEGRELTSGMEAGAYRYLQANAGRELGYKLPKDHEKPLSILQGESGDLQERLEKERGREKRLTEAGKTKQVEKVRGRIAELSADLENTQDKLAKAEEKVRARITAASRPPRQTA